MTRPRLDADHPGLTDREVEDVLRRLFACEDGPEIWMVPTALLAELARRLPEGREGQ